MQTRSVKSSPIIIGKIWAKWCPHCISLIPAWNDMKKIIKRKTNFKPKYMETEESELHKIDQYNESRSDGQFIDKSRGYPTIYKIRGGNIEYYSGERTPQAMADWMMSGVIKGGKSKKLKSRKKRQKEKS